MKKLIIVYYFIFSSYYILGMNSCENLQSAVKNFLETQDQNYLNSLSVNLQVPAQFLIASHNNINGAMVKILSDKSLTSKQSQELINFFINCGGNKLLAQKTNRDINRFGKKNALVKSIQNDEREEALIILSLGNIENISQISSDFPQTPLALALQTKDIELIKEIIQAGADINEITPLGNTLLKQFIIRHDSIKLDNLTLNIINLLIQSGANLTGTLNLTKNEQIRKILISAGAK